MKIVNQLEKIIGSSTPVKVWSRFTCYGLIGQLYNNHAHLITIMSLALTASMECLSTVYFDPAVYNSSAYQDGIYLAFGFAIPHLLGHRGSFHLAFSACLLKAHLLRRGYQQVELARSLCRPYQHRLTLHNDR